MTEPETIEVEEEFRYGLIVLGAPGTGKTTFCYAFQQFL
jgi:predicted PilT family ATPase